MQQTENQNIVFFIKDRTPELFHVVHYEGKEKIGELYHFRITLISKVSDVNLIGLLNKEASLTINYEEEPLTFHGIVKNAIQRHSVNEYYFYDITLVPRFWRLTQSNYYQIFLNMTIVEIITKIFKNNYFSEHDFEFHISDRSKQFVYLRLAYTSQYNESYFNFIRRKMEKFGLYFYFEQMQEYEKIIITDYKESHKPSRHTELLYVQRSGMTPPDGNGVIYALHNEARSLTGKVICRDYHHDHPDTYAHYEEEVMPQSLGTTMYFNDNAVTTSEAKFLAQIRAQAQLAYQSTVKMESTVPFISPGYLYTLQNYFRSDMNKTYLNIETIHRGNQSHLFSDMLGSYQDTQHQNSYSNEAMFINANMQFRLKLETKRAEIHGLLAAKIDGDNNGFPLIDKRGNYHVIMPFDVSNNEGSCKHSIPLRMASPTAGKKKGMHFPLAKDTEVLVGFIGGDPDRPYIAAAIPNMQNPSPVTEKNLTQNILESANNNLLEMDDTLGHEHIKLHSTNRNAFIKMGYLGKQGSDNATVSENVNRYHDENGMEDIEAGGGDGIAMYSTNYVANITNDKSETVQGNLSSTVVGGSTTTVDGDDVKHYNGERFITHTSIKPWTNICASWRIGIDTTALNMTGVRLSFAELAYTNIGMTNNDLSTSAYRLSASAGYRAMYHKGMNYKRVIGTDIKKVDSQIDFVQQKYENGAKKVENFDFFSEEVNKKITTIKKETSLWAKKVTTQADVGTYITGKYKNIADEVNFTSAQSTIGDLQVINKKAASELVKAKQDEKRRQQQQEAEQQHEREESKILQESAEQSSQNGLGDSQQLNKSSIV